MVTSASQRSRIVSINRETGEILCETILPVRQRTRAQATSLRRRVARTLRTAVALLAAFLSVTIVLLIGFAVSAFTLLAGFTATLLTLFLGVAVLGSPFWIAGLFLWWLL